MPRVVRRTQGRAPVQGELRFRGWGGRRSGAGRPREAGAGVSHLTRPRVTRHTPVHITLKLRREVASLRTKAKAGAVRRALVRAVAAGFAVVDWSIQRDHVHLVVEAESSGALSRRVQGLCVRMARGINATLRRRGRVFADRFHAHVLRTPREVRHARAYVLLNARHHAARHGETPRPGWIDPYSSWAWFDGWARHPRGPEPSERGRKPNSGDSPCVRASSWLMRVGWRRHGLVAVEETVTSAR